MRLCVATPLAQVVDVDDVVHLRAEDDTGSFGILPGHADFLTALDASVVSWRHRDGRQGHCAVRRGVLTVRDGAGVSVATREAVVDADLEHLETQVLQEFRARDEAEQSARVESARMELRALREMLRYLRPGGEPGPGGGAR